MAANKYRRPTVLSRRTDFVKIIHNGQRLYPCSWMIINVLENEMGETRYGWTVPRFVGSAVLRNRIKRWIRENVRELQKKRANSKNKSLDINFVIKKKNKDFYKSLKYEDVRSCMEKAFRKLDK